MTTAPQPAPGEPPYLIAAKEITAYLRREFVSGYTFSESEIASIIARHAPAPQGCAAAGELRERIKEFLDECAVAEDRSNLDGDSAEAVLQQINDGAEELLDILKAAPPTVAQASIEEMIGELQGLATASRHVGNHAIGDSIGTKASNLLIEVREVFAMLNDVRRERDNWRDTAKRLQSAPPLPTQGAERLREAAKDAIEAMDALIILAEQNVPPPYLPLKERHVRDRLRAALPTAQSPSLAGRPEERKGGPEDRK